MNGRLDARAPMVKPPVRGGLGRGWFLSLLFLLLALAAVSVMSDPDLAKRLTMLIEER
jgi:hypothetical protein